MLTGFRFKGLSAFGALVTAVLLVVPSVGAQQGGTVTGRVLDVQSGLPISAVQVFISSLDLGGLTQQNGRYLLQNVPAGTHTLAVARIGYRIQEVQITVGGGQTVEQNFSMSEEALQLDEIIVTGTPGGTQRRAIGNTVAVVDVAEITADVAITNFQDLLSGRTTGLRFTRLSGNVGAGSPIQIRGVGSFSLGSNPLIYVDGVRVNNDTRAGPTTGGGDQVSVLNDFNPEDILSVEIIKGPAATTIYGTEASAGVIQIITKRGSQGAPQFNVSIRQGVNFMTNPAQRVGTQWTCPSDPGPGPNDCQAKTDLLSYNMYDEANRYIREGYFPWPTKNLYQNGYTQSYNVDVAGGSGAIGYFASANYENQEGIVWYNTLETFRLRANLNVVFNDQFSLDISTGFVDGYNRLLAPTVSDGGVWQDLIWSNGYYLDRVNPFDNSGPGGSSNARLGGFQEHLPSDVADVEATRDYSRFTGSVTLRHTLGDWLSQRLVVGIDKNSDINRNLFPLEDGPIPLSISCPGNTTPCVPYAGFDPDDGDSWSSVYSETLTGEMQYERPIVTLNSFDYSITLDYDLTDTGFSFGTSFGAQYYHQTTDWFSNSGNGFASPLSRTINQLSSLDPTTYSLVENKSLGLYVSEQVGYEDRIFVTGSLRFDDNSTFGNEAPTQKYPNLQGTWVLSEESFWNVDFVNSLRLRAAWGQAGRQPSATAQNNIFTVIPGPGGTAAIRPSSPGNPGIEPEVSTELEVGADFALLDDRLAGSFTHYWRKDENTLLAQAVLSSNGFPGSVQQNLGRIDAWGWEAQLSISLYRSPSFSFDLDLAADYNNNKIRDLGEFGYSRTFAKGIQWPRQFNSDLVVEAQFEDAATCPRTSAGQPLGTRICDRTNAFGARISALCDSGLSLAPQRHQDAAINQSLSQAQRDAAQDKVDRWGRVPGGVIVPCTEVPDGSVSMGPAYFPWSFRVAPRISLFNNTLTFTALAEGLYGKWSDENGIEWGHRYNNTLVSRLEDDPLWVYQSKVFDQRYGRQYLNNFWKLREISVRYQLPQSALGPIGAERASIAFSARNLYTLYRSQDNINGGQIADPEYATAATSGDGNYWETPPLASLNLTLRVTF